MSVGRIVLLAAVAAALVSGCGGSGGDSSTDQAAATATWADGVCKAINSWQSSVTSATQTLKGGDVSKQSLTTAASGVQEATKTLSDDLKGLGKPDTKSGDQAQQSLQTLSDTISTNADDIRTAIDGASGVSGALSAVSVVTAKLATVGDAARSTVQDLTQLDAGSELQHAFQQSKSCSDLRSK